jgi:hypothetical protein
MAGEECGDCNAAAPHSMLVKRTDTPQSALLLGELWSIRIGDRELTSNFAAGNAEVWMFHVCIAAGQSTG